MQHSVYATIEDEKAKKEFKAKVMEKERKGIKAASRRCPKQVEVGSKERFRNQIPEEVRRREKAARAAWKRQRFGSKCQNPLCGMWKEFLLEVGSLGWQQLGLEAPRRRVISFCPNVEVLQWCSDRYEQGETRDNSLQVSVVCGFS